MQITKILNRITNHPLTVDNKLSAMSRFIKWQIKSKLSDTPIIHQFVGPSSLLIKKGLTGATANLYMGLGEFKDMSFVLHFLREEDYFADVGANIGAYTILATKVCQATSYSFEPIPTSFNHLQENIHLNEIENKVNAFPLGLGEKEGFLTFTNNLDLNNHVSIDNFNDKNFISIEVKKLDQYNKSKGFNLLKIDVEGFETAVLEGATGTLRNPALQAIIIELDGLGEKFGFDEKKLDKHICSFGFKKYTYQPFQRKLIPIDQFDFPNTIYIRDFDFASKRIANAKSFKILGKTI